MNKKNIQQPKPFCKICFDAGKSPLEYESHYVRSSTGPDSKVVCPTLLALNCRFCHESGHTVNYCKVLAQRKKQEERMQRISRNMANFAAANASAASALKASNLKTPKNSFALLDLSDAEDEASSDVEDADVDVDVPMCETSCAVSASVSASAPIVSSYAAIAAKPAPPAPAVAPAPVKQLIVPYVDSDSVFESVSVTQPVRRRWADYITSDEEEEDEEEDDYDW
jgi:hypothetical protein